MKKPAVFLDRDGVLAVEKGYVTKLSDLELFPYAKDGISRMHELGYLAIVVTNQSAIARGILTVEELYRMNYFLMEEIKVDAIYACPHSGKEDIPCTCRKPGTAMVEKAIQEHDIEKRGSYFVGDRASDIETGLRSKLQTVLLESGYGIKRLEKAVKPDYVCKDLIDFINRILIG
ncbi:HAD-IIIA family hydrolase [Lachnospiraceae bacterium ZAX-1]